MEKKTNKKFIAAIASLAMVVCLAVGGLVGVLAASSQTINSSFNVQYSIGEGIAGSIAAQYQYAKWDYTNSSIAMVGTEATSFGSYDFDVTTNQSEAESFAAGNVTLEANEKNAVVFTYTFVNDGQNAYTVTLTENLDSASNLTLSYKKDNAASNKAAISSFEVAAPAQAGEATTVTVEITMYITNQNLAASLAGSLNWALTNSALNA